MGRTGFDQMMAGLGALSGSMKEFSQTRAISNAQDELNSLNSMEMDEAAKRQKQMMISQNLAMNLSKTGGDLRSAAMLMPQPLNATDAFIKQGRQDQIDSREDQQAHTSQMADKRYAQAMALQGMKNQAPGKKKAGDLNFGVNVEIANQEGKKLLKLIESDGNWETWNEKTKAELDSSQYQLAINYAKIVDPDSVAREGEVAAAQKYLIPLGLTTRNKTSQAAIKKYLRVINNYKKVRDRLSGTGGASSAGGADDAIQTIQEDQANDADIQSIFSPIDD